MRVIKSLLSHPRSLWLRIPVWIVALWVLLFVGHFFVDLLWPSRPKPLEAVALLDHAQTQTIGPVRVTVAALGPNESRAVVGVGLALYGIQPLWLEVENGDTVPLFYMQADTDPEWLSPHEVYWLRRFKAPRKANRLIEDRFYDLQFGNPVFPAQTHSGFVYTRLDERVKALDLDLGRSASAGAGFRGRGSVGSRTGGENAMVALKRLMGRPRSLWLRIPVWIVALWILLLVGRFFTDLVWPYRPKPLEAVAFLDHAQTQTIGPVRVTASALGPNESRAVFGVGLALYGIQPVWLEVENGDTLPLFYMQAGTDPEWFSPYEVYWLSRFKAPRGANRLMEDRFYDLQFRNPVFPAQTHAGFIYTRLDEGVKALDLDLVGIGEVAYNFTLSVDVPGFRSDYSRVDFDHLYSPDSMTVVDTEEDLRRALERLPCCTTDRGGAAAGDPLNLIVVGDPAHVFPAFSRRGWHPTEQTYSKAIWRTIRSFLFRSRYRYSPVSPLYVFGRRQDIAAQKARGTINLRNHARFWLAPILFRGNTVWIGQISRDIGVRFILGFPPTTHKIDPDVDEARSGLIQDLAYSQALARFAFVGGVGTAPRDEPRSNLTGDAYFTDGLRAVLFFDARPRTLHEVEYLEWERPTRYRVYEERVRGRTGPHPDPVGRPQ
jgi:hypothetical protein